MLLRAARKRWSFDDILRVWRRPFYIETFGCQMNAHDSEKVIGTLEHEGYMRVRDEADAGLILYNTCSVATRRSRRSSTG